jgi:hypothetical protein
MLYQLSYASLDSRAVPQGAWSGRRGSNPQPTAWKAVTLPIELLPLLGEIRRGDRVYTAAGGLLKSHCTKSAGSGQFGCPGGRFVTACPKPTERSRPPGRCGRGPALIAHCLKDGFATRLVIERGRNWRERWSRRRRDSGGGLPASVVQSNRLGGPLAQRLEQRTHNPLVVGSNPTGPTNVFNELRASGSSCKAPTGRRHLTRRRHRLQDVHTARRQLRASPRLL